MACSKAAALLWLHAKSSHLCTVYLESIHFLEQLCHAIQQQYGKKRTDQPHTFGKKTLSHGNFPIRTHQISDMVEMCERGYTVNRFRIK